MQNKFSKQQQNPTKEGVLFPLTKNRNGDNKMENNFKNLIESYALRARDIHDLSKDELFGLTLAYIENKCFTWPWNRCGVDNNIDVVVTVGMLRKLNNNIYNHQRAFLEEFKDSVIASQIDNVSEALDDEIEQVRKERYEDYDTDKECVVVNATLYPLAASTTDFAEVREAA